MIVKADSATLKIPELEFEIPPNTQKGSINTLEGFMQLSITELEKDQPARKVIKYVQSTLLLKLQLPLTFLVRHGLNTSILFHTCLALEEVGGRH